MVGVSLVSSKEALVSLLDQAEAVYCPDEVMWQLDSQECEAGHTLTSAPLIWMGRNKLITNPLALWYAGVKGECEGAVMVWLNMLMSCWPEIAITSCLMETSTPRSESSVINDSVECWTDISVQSWFSHLPQTWLVPVVFALCLLFTSSTIKPLVASSGSVKEAGVVRRFRARVSWSITASMSWGIREKQRKRSATGEQRFSTWRSKTLTLLTSVPVLKW